MDQVAVFENPSERFGLELVAALGGRCGWKILRQ